jgi:hypothetical protein
MLRPDVVPNGDLRKVCASILKIGVARGYRQTITNLVDENNEVDLRIEGAPRTGVGLLENL